METNNTTNTTDEPVDPIQAAYDAASYDVKKYLESNDFVRTVDLITQANKVSNEVNSEINFIVLMIALKTIPYNSATGTEVVRMLTEASLSPEVAKQVWSDVETYIIPKVPELGVDSTGNDADLNLTVNRSVIMDTATGDSHATHFGPDAIEMRLKGMKVPRITLSQLSKGESLLQTSKVDQSVSAKSIPINYKSHTDPYREITE